MIAIALSCNPSVLIADEPTTALDVTIQAQVLNLILEMKEKYQTAIMLITHDMGIIANFVQIVYVMYHGKVVECTTVENIFNNPKHPYTIGLLESIPTLEYDKNQPLKQINGSVPTSFEKINGCSFYKRCNYAKDICKNNSPSLLNINPYHQVSCWLHS